MNKAELIDCLLSDLHLWGSNATKKIEHLAREIEAGRADIYREPRGRLIYRYETVGVNFMHQPRNGFRRENQVLVRRSALPGSSALFDIIGTSISVPKHPEEIALVVAIQAIQRFFPFEDNARIGITSYHPKIMDPTLTNVYPGLYMMHVIYPFSWIVSREHYAPAGYSRKEFGESVLYRWLTLD